VVSNDIVRVFGPEQVTLPREQLTGITPGGNREVDFWSGKASLGLNFQRGNTRQATESASAELARRTPATVIQLNYLGNFSEVNGEQNANNHRITGYYDIRLNRDWFLRPLQVEYYRDQLANLAHRGTLGVGLVTTSLIATDSNGWFQAVPVTSTRSLRPWRRPGRQDFNSGGDAAIQFQG